MEAHGPSLHAVLADTKRVRERTRGRLSDRGLDPDRVIGEARPNGATDVTGFYDILGVMAASEKAGQGPTHCLARLALAADLPSEVRETLFLAYNQQSAEEAGHGDKVFGNAYFSMGGVAPGGEYSVFGDGRGVASGLDPSGDPPGNARLLATIAGTIGGIETVALQRLFPRITALCERWNHPIGIDLAKQIRDVVRPEESRHVLIWRYVFHRVIVSRGPSQIDEYMQATNAGRSQLAAPMLEREDLERMLGVRAPTARQLLGKDRTLHG